MNHRQGLIVRRDVLLARYYDAIERADAELELATTDTGRWEARVVTLFGDHALELRALIAAIERCDRGTYGHCMGCGGPMSSTVLDTLPTVPRCSDCAITHVMPAMT